MKKEVFKLTKSFAWLQLDLEMMKLVTKVAFATLSEHLNSIISVWGLNVSLWLSNLIKRSSAGWPTSIGACNMNNVLNLC